MENYRQKARLTVYNIREEDFGAYKCVSKNSLGETESTVRLYGQLYGTFIFDGHSGYAYDGKHFPILFFTW